MRSNTIALHKDAEWIDARRAFMLFTLGRTTLTRLAREKKIRSCSLAEAGMARGKRLYSSADLRDFLAKRAEEAAA
jgi:hypothetical protein